MRGTYNSHETLDAACWAVALRLKVFGYAEIAAEAHVSTYTAREVVRAWHAAGRCKQIERKHAGAKRNIFEIVETSAPRQARIGSVPQNLWNSMRGLKAFTPTDLAAHSTTPTVEVSVEAAQGYCQALFRAGYLRVDRKAIPGRREAIYRLVRNSGPRPPRERRVRAVWDENLEEFTHIAGALK